MTSLYQNNSRIKLVLLLISIFISLLTLWYTGRISKKIRAEETKQATIWANAIQNKANLLRYTNQLFQKLSNGERAKVEQLANATKLILEVENIEVSTFLAKIIADNENIPVILVDDDNHIIDKRNINLEGINDSLYFRGALLSMFSQYPPIQIAKGQYIYYNDSKLFTELQSVLNHLIESFISESIINSASVPTVLMDESQNLLAYGNVDGRKLATPQTIRQLILNMKANNPPIILDFGTGNKRYIYYDNSYILKQIKYFPYVQLCIFGLFIFLAYLVFSSNWKAEQNLVWVGMSKETAHQLGTPISSLSAWVEYLKDTDINRANMNMIVSEIDKDIERLTLVADRFSKIGAKAKLEKCLVKETLEKSIDYIRVRSSDKVLFSLQVPSEITFFYINPLLFEWVIENILKNALDAMSGEGNISIRVLQFKSKIAIDISDTGKGMPKNKFKAIFKPGYSTKKRGWGLGLSLAKRIISEYHSGDILVKESILGKGTTFRILL